MPTEEALGPRGGGYETRLTSYSNLEPAAGRRIADALIDLSAKLKPGPVPNPPALPPFHGQAVVLWQPAGAGRLNSRRFALSLASASRLSASNLFPSESDPMKRQASVLLPFVLGLAVAAAAVLLFRGQSSPARGDSGQTATGGGDVASRSADRSGMLAELAVLNDFRAGRVSSVRSLRRQCRRPPGQAHHAR